MRTGEGESGRGVIEFAIGPLHGVVASFAGSRERSGNVVHRRGGLVVIGLMAAHAGGAAQVVVVIDVAIRALPRRHDVRSRERKSGAVVIEGCVQPGARAVALIAGLREIRGHMVRIRRALIVSQVATDARGAGQVVIVVLVAIRALPGWHGVQSRQRKTGGGVIKFLVRP